MTKEERKEYMAKYYQKNKERINKYKTEYQKFKRSFITEQQKKRRVERLGNDVQGDPDNAV